MPRTAANIAIPLPEDEALRLLLKVKPAEGMPRPGANRSQSIVTEMDVEYGPLPAPKRTKRPK